MPHAENIVGKLPWAQVTLATDNPAFYGSKCRTRIDYVQRRPKIRNDSVYSVQRTLFSRSLPYGIVSLSKAESIQASQLTAHC